VFEFLKCFDTSPLILTEGSVGLRLANEFGLTPDKQIMYASLIYESRGRQALEHIYGQYLRVAMELSLPILLMTNTRRVNKERALNSPYKNREIISDYADFLREVTAKYGREVYIGGYMGCKGDGYTGEGSLTREAAETFHAWQIEAFERSSIDFIMTSIMPNVDETIGLARAIEKSSYPYLISFMIRESGTVIDGSTIHDAIGAVEGAVKRRPLCYMTNCVHPRILKHALRRNDTALVRSRFMGIQSNAAYLSPEELEGSVETKSSGADELADEVVALDREFPLKIYGGCCGTDDTHIREFASRLCRTDSCRPFAVDTKSCL